MGRLVFGVLVTAIHNPPRTVMGRVLLLLEPFREAGSLTLTELSEYTGFPRSSTHRLLSQLVRVGWLRRSGTTYYLGPKMVELGSLAQHHDRIYRAAVDIAYRLHQRTAMAVHLTVLDGDDVLYLEKVGGRWAATALPTRVGQRRPARDTAEGAALLARRAGQRPAVRENIAECGAGGRVWCVAMAFDAGHREIAALSLTGSVGRIPPGVDRDLALAVDLVTSKLSH